MFEEVGKPDQSSFYADVSEAGGLGAAIQAHLEAIASPLAENIANGKLGDKLAGWPAWVQNVEYPACPRCGRQMIHVFQVDPEHNVPFMFGVVGCGHITQRPEHKEVVAFGWACH